MYYFSACHVLLCMLMYQQTPVVYLQTLTLTVETSPLKCGNEVELKCLYSGPTCCIATTRVWKLDGNIIMNNGAPVVSATNKYKEERNDANNYFIMKILNLQDSDFGKAFQCKYDFIDSTAITLTKDLSYECDPADSCTFDHEEAGDKITVTGGLNLSKAAPSPKLAAFYGEENMTSKLIIARENYDTWYYNITVKVGDKIDCLYRFSDDFVVTANDWTICEKNLCACVLCGLFFHLLSLSVPGSGVVSFVIYLIYIKICKKDCEKGAECGKLLLITALYIILCLTTNAGITWLIGTPVCPCNECWFWIFIFMLSMVTGVFVIVLLHPIFNFDLAYIKEKSWCEKLLFGIALFISGGSSIFFCSLFNAKWLKCIEAKVSVKVLYFIALIVSTLLILPIPVLVVYFAYLKGGNNRSKESGSSCWPPCSVGPDPNSPDPENARSLLKKNADKKNEKKPVAVVRSQPPKNRHVKTDNTESTRYSAETEIFDEGVHKSAKPRPLPSIGQPTNSPRPLPQMPPSSQLEKGGIQLEPLGDSTSEKKKKKRRKKKESKQSGDED